jgi:hypothetical protein
MVGVKAPCAPALLTSQLIWLGALFPPTMAAVFCLLTKARGAASGSSNSRWIRNASDWVAFLTWTAFGYAVLFFALIYAHFACC